MRIEQLEYRNRATGWHLTPTEFSDLTLLVGVSGVGKTQILDAILNLKKIANGASLSGVDWDITFVTGSGIMYRWMGQYEDKGSDEFYDLLDKEFKEQVENKAKIIYEKVFLNQKLIVERDAQAIFLNGHKTPRLSPVESVVKIFSEEEKITPVYKGINKIILSNDEKELLATMLAAKFNVLVKRFQNLEEIQDSNLLIHLKLALAYKHGLKIFDQIKQNYVGIFPQVEDILLEPISQEGVHVLWAEFPLLQIKEKGVNQWISQPRISAGMRKSLLQISEIYLSPDGTVILIDEFENSLGVNCIDILTEMLSQNRNQQFIITSHHPYIINNIDMKHWKILTRTGGEVTARDAKDFNLGHSRHDAFIQLINLEAFTEGIAA